MRHIYGSNRGTSSDQASIDGPIAEDSALDLLPRSATLKFLTNGISVIANSHCVCLMILSPLVIRTQYLTTLANGCCVKFWRPVEIAWAQSNHLDG